MASFFNNIYKYKQSDLRHQKENFLTEILAHCLETDEIFRFKFLTLIGFTPEVSCFTCQTQMTDDEFGKPDIFITINNDTAIIIECKIDTTQEETQLKRYSEFLLKHSYSSKHLIYLTKYFEETTNFPKEITFKSLRWYKISDLLFGTTNNITKEFHNYLIEEKMSTIISFNKSELKALKEFNETLSKMREFLELLKETLSSLTKSKVRFQNLIENGNYGILCDFHGGKLWLGFYQYEDDDEMQLCISSEDIPQDTPNFTELSNELILLNWNQYNDDNEAKQTFFNNKNLSLFFDNETFNTNKAHNFLESELIKIKRWL